MEFGKKCLLRTCWSCIKCFFSHFNWGIKYTPHRNVKVDYHKPANMKILRLSRKRNRIITPSLIYKYVCTMANINKTNPNGCT